MRPAAAARTGWPSRPAMPMPDSIPPPTPKLATIRPSVGHDQRGRATCAGGGDERAGGAAGDRRAGDGAERGGGVDARGVLARVGVGGGEVLAS